MRRNQKMHVGATLDVFDDGVWRVLVSHLCTNGCQFHDDDRDRWRERDTFLVGDRERTAKGATDDSDEVLGESLRSICVAI